VQLKSEDEMADLVHSSLKHLDQLEAAFIRDYFLGEPKVTLAAFANQWHLSATELAELRRTLTHHFRELMARKGIYSIGDIL
jgi:hypothetical protein